MTTTNTMTAAELDGTLTTLRTVLFGQDSQRPAHHADARAILEDDILSAQRGLQMAQLAASDLYDLMYEHAHRDAFASAVIVVGAARRLWLTGAMDLTRVCSAVLVAVARDPAQSARAEVGTEIERRCAEVERMLSAALQGLEL